MTKPTNFQEQGHEGLPVRRFASSRNLSLKVCKALFESQSARYGKLTRSKSGLAPKVMTERQHLNYDKFALLKIQKRRKGLHKSSGFKKQPRGASAPHNIPRGLIDRESMEISIHSDTTHEPCISSTASMSVVSQPSSVGQQMLDQLAQMKTMLTSEQIGDFTRTAL